MFRIVVFFLLLFALAAGFAWLADNPGTVEIQWPWLQASVKGSLLQAVIAIAAVTALIMMVWWVVSGVINSPKLFGNWLSGRRREKGYMALSKGMVAAGAGNAATARKLANESAKLLDNEPLVAMLNAQTLLLEGKRGDAREKFEEMVEKDETKLLGLRGLYIEAEREGEVAAAAHFAKSANETSPGTPWAAKALLKAQTLGQAWEPALKTLQENHAFGLITKPEFQRKRAVILTALALEEEDAAPDKAKGHALTAHKLAVGLVPASITAARICQRLGDNRKAAKVLESSWKDAPHPEIADAYINLRSGDTASERLKRAEKLSQKKPDSLEGHLAIARSAVDAGEWTTARTAMKKVLKAGATERACLLMADIEQAEHGDAGRVREWLSRAVSAERDPVWTADGMVSDHWQPLSPTTGQLDAFEWKIPVAALGDPANTVDYSDLANEPLPKPAAPVVEKEADTTALDDIEDATIIDDDKEEAEAEAVSPEIVSIASAGTVVAATLSNEAEKPTNEPITEAEIIELKPVAAKLGDEQTTEAASAPAPEPESAETAEKPLAKKEAKSPYANANLDDDEDGVIDRRPDDPGISQEEESQPKKGLFF